MKAKFNYPQILKFSLLLVMGSLSITKLNAQTQIVLPTGYTNDTSGSGNFTPDPADNAKIYDSYISSGASSTNYGTRTELVIGATASGTSIQRALINFPELSPSNSDTISYGNCLSQSSISQALLYLYNTQQAGDYSELSGSGVYNSGVGTSNAIYVERITSSWSESTVTWANQPSTTTTNRISRVAATSDPVLNVTNMTKDMVSGYNFNGYMVKLQNESPASTVLWKLGSSEWCSAAACTASASLSDRPKLIVTYVYDASYCRIMYAGDKPLKSEVLSDGSVVNEVSVFPNPFTSNTTVSYTLHHDSPVTFSIYDLTGKEIKNYPASTSLQAGHYEKNLSDFEAAPGIYLLKIQANGHTQTHKLVKSL
jgi:hypothetical protein